MNPRPETARRRARLNVELGPELLSRVRAIARAEFRSAGSVVRQLVAEGLARWPGAEAERHEREEVTA